MLRGDVFYLRAPRKARGHEQQGERYGVVVQASELLALSTVIVAPTSTKARPATFRPTVEIDGSDTKVLVEQIGAVDHTRLGTHKGRLSWQELEQVEDALRMVLGLAL